MGNYSFTKLPMEGAVLIDSFSVRDGRGGFAKLFEKDIYEEAGISFKLNETFVSASEKNVIRGMHFQLHSPQAKLVSVVSGTAYDVIVDLRPDSPSYRQWGGYTLSAENCRALYIPRGFAHGFMAQEDNTVMLYQCDGKYDKETDTGIRFDDPVLGIEWPAEDLASTIHSARDLSLMSFEEYEKHPMELQKWQR